MNELTCPNCKQTAYSAVPDPLGGCPWCGTAYDIPEDGEQSFELLGGAL